MRESSLRRSRKLSSNDKAIIRSRAVLGMKYVVCSFEEFDVEAVKGVCGVCGRRITYPTDFSLVDKKVCLVCDPELWRKDG